MDFGDSSQASCIVLREAVLSWLDTRYVQGGPERSRQSNLALFAVEGGLDSKLPVAK